MNKINQRILLFRQRKWSCGCCRHRQVSKLETFVSLLSAYSWARNSSLRLRHGSGAILHISRIELEVSPTQINLHRRNRFKNNALLTNLLDLYLCCFSDSDAMTVTDVEDNVSSSDPEPMWESESTSASIFKVLLCRQRYIVARSENYDLNTVAVCSIS